jgi:RimJ/RimL family protein N-acetyltransferase
VIITERLRLRPASTADIDFWVRLHADPEVNRFVGPYTRERAETRLRGIEDSWATRGYGLCVVESLATGEAIGRSGLNWWEQFGETEVGWTFRRDHWGKGYATEAASAVVDWGVRHPRAGSDHRDDPPREPRVGRGGPSAGIHASARGRNPGASVRGLRTGPF